jgi:hypothetical protein
MTCRPMRLPASFGMVVELVDGVSIESWHSRSAPSETVAGGAVFTATAK